MARSPNHRGPPDEDPLSPADLQLLDMIRAQDETLRAGLCTLARYGVAFRQRAPARTARWLDLLSRHPLYKAGQFLFDLLEWEDFMLDGEPPPVLGPARLAAILQQLAHVLRAFRAQLEGSPLDFDLSAMPPTEAEPPDLPALEPGFYLYRDVVLGVLDIITRSMQR